MHPSTFGKVQEVADAFGNLQPNVVQRAARGDLPRFGRQYQRNLQLPLRFAQEQHLTAPELTLAHEACDVGCALETVIPLQLALNAAQLTLPWRRAQCTPPEPRCGLSP